MAFLVGRGIYMNSFDYLTLVVSLIVTYIAGRRICRVLYQELPWKASNIHYTDANSHGIGGEVRRAFTRSHWFLSMIVKFLLVYCVFQSVLVAHAVMHKCRWSRLAGALAAHYKKIDYMMRPKITPMDQLPAFLKVASYLVLSNGVALFLLYQFRKAFNTMWHSFGPEKTNELEIIKQENEKLGKAAWILEPFCVIWLFLAYGLNFICTYSEHMFLEFLINSRNVTN